MISSTLAQYMRQAEYDVDSLHATVGRRMHKMQFINVLAQVDAPTLELARAICVACRIPSAISLADVFPAHGDYLSLAARQEAGTGHTDRHPQSPTIRQIVRPANGANNAQ
jgi:hypothetical protein